MEVKRAKVIMLPTKGKSQIQLFTDTTIEYWTSPIKVKKGFGKQAQHLYITTNDEIKEGDWCLNTKTNQVLQFLPNKEHKKDTKGMFNVLLYLSKIIATTDKSLKYALNDKKSIWYNNLPQPSQAFVEKYCEVGGIDEVDVEYELDACLEILKSFEDCGCKKGSCKNGKWTPKVDSHNTITIHPIKDSWNREELKTLCYKHSNDQILGALLRKIIL